METNQPSQRRFSGIDRLYGTGSLTRLAAAHVCVIGIGGVGSWAAEALARSGIGRFTLIDLDHIAESNINRQAHALEATLGQAKVVAMAQRMVQINPACALTCSEDFITPENLATLLPACDVVLDCIDQVKAKAALIAHCRHYGQALVTTGGAGGRTDPTRVRSMNNPASADCGIDGAAGLACAGYGSAMTVTAAFGLAAAAQALGILLP